MTDPEQTFALVERHISPVVAMGNRLFRGGAVEATAEGAQVTLSDGQTAIDFGSYGVTMLGHRHPAVVQAVTEQLGRQTATTRLVANPVVLDFIDDIVRRIAPSHEGVWLGSDGADVVELALKLARKSTGRLRVLAVERAFHGKTLGALATTWDPIVRGGLEPLLGHVTFLPADDPEAAQRELAKGDVAALIFEPVQGESGARPLDLDVLRRWTGDAHDAGAVVISDEIQAGLHRCGAWSLALDAGLPVDAVLYGKALGAGIMPISALLATRELFGPMFENFSWHSSTAGSQPLACAAARATLDVVEELAPRAAELGERFGTALADLQARHPQTVREARGQGLLRGLDLGTPEVSGTVILRLAQSGVIVSPCLTSPETIRLLPPMVTTDAQLETAMEVFDDVLAEADRTFGASEPAEAGSTG